MGSYRFATYHAPAGGGAVRGAHPHRGGAVRRHGGSIRYLRGAALIAWGIAILLFPELLAVLVAGSLIFGGIVAIGIARAVGRAERAFEDWESVERRER